MAGPPTDDREVLCGKRVECLRRRCCEQLGVGLPGDDRLEGVLR